jgi:hypothetical protein
MVVFTNDCQGNENGDGVVILHNRQAMFQKMFFHAEADSVNEAIYIMSSNICI